MSGPDIVRIKRRRSEEAPEALLVERSGKRQQKESNAAIQYVLRKDKDTTDGLFSASDVQTRGDGQTSAGGSARGKPARVPGSGLDGSQRAGNRERRTFHLKRPSTPEAGVKKRKAKDEGIATFIEKRAKQNAQGWLDARGERPVSQTAADAVEPLKRPGKHSAMRSNCHVPSGATTQSNGHMKNDSRMEAVANSLHLFAMEEAAKEAAPKPKVTTMPRLPPQRSRELHRQRASQSSAKTQDRPDADVDMDEDANYVYDTYVLAPTAGAGAAQVEVQGESGNVGYLIITEEDQAVWETYIEDEPSDKDWNSDEDDENAEDWYGADYPDDELASDDEFNRNAYGYRANAGSDDEEWDQDTGNYSDDEYERQMNPWRKKTPQQFSRYFGGGNQTGVDE